MKENDDINSYLPSLLNPRSVKKQNTNFTLTQNSVVSRCSLSLKKNNSLNVKNTLSKFFPTKNISNWNDTIITNTQDTSFTQEKATFTNNNQCKFKSQFFPTKNISNLNDTIITNIQGTSFTQEKATFTNNNYQCKFKSQDLDKENNKNSYNNLHNTNNNKNKTIDENSVGFSAIEDLETVIENGGSSPFSFGNINVTEHVNINKNESCNESLISVSSDTELDGGSIEDSEKTIVCDLHNQMPLISVSFGVNNCDTVNVSTNKSNIKNLVISHKDNMTKVDCDIIEPSQISSASESDLIMDDVSTPQKKSTIAVNLEIKRKRPANDTREKSKVLILNTDDISKLSHVIVQPPNYKSVKLQILNHGKRRAVGSSVNNGKSDRCDNLKQKSIEYYLSKPSDVLGVPERICGEVSASRIENVVGEVMSRNLGIVDAVKCESLRKSGVRRREDASPRKGRVEEAKRHVRVSSSDGQRPSASPRARYDSAVSHSPRKINVDSLPFSVPSKSKSNKTSISPRNIPLYKIVAGTHFAVDAFSYGDIPNVKHYFLTHFHSDHYSGLKKGFNKFLFCSKITADLCVTRLGVSPKFIRIINFDETISVDGVEVTAVDANHCPGALMLVFTLPNGKTLLHTGDFRATPVMESYPVFWNRDINTVYLDTTYCNPRYDFPTQDHSLEMALYLLRQKKMALEKLGKKFTSVLIVCGTYTIGKEKFFLGMARRVGCSVWACPEKDRVLHAVEGRSFSHAAPHSCQLHVVPMRDLTHEKLRNYLDTLNGAFSEVVAFKPSGWENGKNTAVEKDNVTIHGIPYSEHSSFSELIRFVKFLKPKQVVPTVDISGGVKSVQKYFPCPLVCKEDMHLQSKVTDYFSIQNRQQSPAIT